MQTNWTIACQIRKKTTKQRQHNKMQTESFDVLWIRTKRKKSRRNCRCRPMTEYSNNKTYICAQQTRSQADFIIKLTTTTTTITNEMK